MNKYHMILELNKVIDLVKEETILDANKEELSNLVLMNEIDDIRYALEETDEATRLVLRAHRFPLYFNAPMDFYLSKIHKGGIITLEELSEVGKFLDTIKNIVLYIDDLDNAEIACPYFKNNTTKLFYPKELNLRIKEIITPYGEIKDDASATLKDIRRHIKDTEKNIQVKLQEIIAKNSSKLSQAIVSIRNDRYVIPVKNDFKNTIKGIIHDQSASGETVYIEPQLIGNLNNHLNQLFEDEKQEIHRILKEISKQIDFYHDALIINYQIIKHLDLVFSKACYAIRINASKPLVNNQGYVDLINCYHPLLKVDTIVRNNISIGKNYQSIIITGPNTGGKTVLLKTIGLLSLMVKAGMLIPCDETSNMMIFDHVYADIGDEQSIDQNLSTFSSHLKNVINIINQVTQNSLVLLDELGSGTDPAEGSSLAIAIIDYLITKKCLIIATSHYSELKIHAYNSENIINASVEFNVATLSPTYKLLIGIPGQSNALKISQILGLHPEIISQAETYVYKNTDKNNVVLDKLIQQSHELDYKLKMIDEKNNSLAAKLKDADRFMEETYIEKNKILAQAEIEARKIITKSSQKIDDILQELEKMKLREVKLHEVAEVKHEIKELKTSIHVEEEYREVHEELLVGASVFVESYHCYGTILKQNKNNKYDVQIGNATIVVDRKALKIPKAAPQIAVVPSIKQTPTNTSGIKKTVKASLDLRGERYEDAYSKLEKYLDDAIFSGLNQVSIIHGFGTGVLREMVQNYLRSSRFVESFRYGGNNEGGQGATIVTLKK
ncbi:MAG: endonuclease MutS2 [Bacilli bacterium]|nr:endonuclease MutS2 [Bacilli bacterium]MDD3348476.1 endonuclease MutS2 [Bacilli bacterium]MDY0209115.1 endonuclease MutS2 [Bacilli bacterium]